MQKKSNYTYYLYYYICSNEIFHTVNMNVVDLRLRPFKVTRPSFFGGVPSYFEALWYPHLYFYRKSNTQNG